MQPVIELLQQNNACGIDASVGVYNEVPLQIGQVEYRWVTQQLFKSALLRFAPLPNTLR